MLMSRQETAGAGSGEDGEHGRALNDAPPSQSPSAASPLDVSAISLHIALDTPPASAVKPRCPDSLGSDRILQPEQLSTTPLLPPASAPQIAGPVHYAPGQAHAGPPLAAGCLAHPLLRGRSADAVRRPPGLSIDTETSAREGTDAGTSVLQTPQNVMRSPATLQRETWSMISSSSVVSSCLQTPARRRGHLAELEESLLAETGGAMICLYSEDMAPLVSVSHGMQLPRAQLGLLGACFTSCRSNAYELYKVQAGGSTIAYRSHLGGRVLALVVLSSWGGSSGSLLDSMLKRMHDNVWAAVCLVVGEQNMLKMLEANKVSSVRKALKAASVLLQHLLTGRTGLELLTGAVAAIPHLTPANSAKACLALEHACRTLAVPAPHIACILAGGKLCVATASWCRLISEMPDRQEATRDSAASHGRPNAEEEVQTDILLLHLLAANVASESQVALTPVYGLTVVPAANAPRTQASTTSVGDSRTWARRDSVSTSAHRLMVLRLAAAEGGGMYEEGEAVSVSGDLRLCLLVPEHDSVWALPGEHQLTHVGQKLEHALYPLLLPPGPVGMGSTIKASSDSQGWGRAQLKGLSREDSRGGNAFSKVLYIVTLYRKYTRAVTFENV